MGRREYVQVGRAGFDRGPIHGPPRIPRSKGGQERRTTRMQADWQRQRLRAYVTAELS